MVHASYKQGHVTTGTLGIPNVNDCDGQISRAQWDMIVRNDAVAARDEERSRQDERRKRQAEQAAYLQYQVDMKLNSQRAERINAIAEESTSLERTQRTCRERQRQDHEFLMTYRQYLDRCQQYSDANRSTASSSVGFSPRKQPLQAGAGLMPFVEPAELRRQQIDAAARTSKTFEARKVAEDQRSHSPREMFNERWKVQQGEYQDEMGEIERRERMRQGDMDRRREQAERRALRATAVAPSPRQQVEELSVSPAHGQSASSSQIPTRRELQASLRQSLEAQLAEKRRLQDEEFQRTRDKDRAAMKTLNDTIHSTRQKEKKQKEESQLSYRCSLETQLQAHGGREERGFLPEVAVKPFRRQYAPVGKPKAPIV